MGRAVCVRCGADRAVFDATCPACGFRPEGEGRLVAWLLSDEHLEPKELDAAQARIRSGDSIEPGPRLLAKARKALQQDFATDPGMTGPQRIAVMLCSVFLTPLVGWTLWWTWRTSRPRAAWQAFALSAPATVGFFLFGLLYLS